MPPKRKTTDKNNESVTTKKSKASWTPFDPSLPNNLKFPEKVVITDQDKEKAENTITIASFNVAGLQASMKKGFHDYVKAENADILCIQETKVNAPVSTAVDDKVYKYRYWAFEEKKGYGKQLYMHI